MADDQVKKLIEEYYTVSTWGGCKNYECRHCKFKSVNKEMVLQHLEQHIKHKIPDKLVETNPNVPVKTSSKKGGKK